MQRAVLNWLGHEFLALGAEANPGTSPAAQAKELFGAFAETLDAHGLSLADTVRSRLYGCDRAARDAGSEVRAETLTGPARAATSSYIAPKLFASGADIAMDLIALRRAPGMEKEVRENDPPRTPCRYLTCGPLIVFSGQTCVVPTLKAQVCGDILPRITGYLAEKGAGWDDVQDITCFLHESQTADALRGLIEDTLPVMLPRLEVRFVEGYSAEGKLVEIEVTALRPA